MAIDLLGCESYLISWGVIVMGAGNMEAPYANLNRPLATKIGLSEILN
jgi:hypothetical protein